jgi:ABC-type glycerol-3-phosphate transport system substrate-binding protein
VTFTYAFYGSPLQIKVYSQLARLYERTHPGVHIQTTYDSAGGFLGKLPEELGAGTQPDVANMAESWMALLQSTFGPFVNLQPYLTRAGLSQANFYPGTFSPGALDGEQLMLPNVVYGDAVAVNESLFAKYHVPLPKPGWTATQFVADAQALTHGSGANKIYGVATPLGNQNVPQLFGGSLFNHVTNKMTITAPATVHAIQWSVNLVKKWHVAPANNIEYSSSSASLVDPFFTGHAAMDLTWVSYSQYNYAQEIGSKFKWNIYPYPVNLDGVLQLNGGTILRGPHNPPRLYPAEFAFIKWLAVNPAALQIQGQISSPAYLPGLKQWLAHPPAIWKGINLQASLATIARSPYVYDGAQWTEIWNDFANQMQLMLTTNEPVAKGISIVNKEGQTILSQLGF